MADGNLKLRVETGNDTALSCPVVVVVSGVLRSRVGINFPMHSLSVSAFTAKDREDLHFGIAQKAWHQGRHQPKADVIS